MRYTVGQYLDQWLADHRGLRRRTRKSYGEHIEYYLKPYLGHIDLDQLSIAHLTEMFAAIEADNERISCVAGERRRLPAAARQAWRSGDKAAHKAARAELAGLPPHRRTVGAATMQRIRATLRSALADAVGQGLVTVNVAMLTKLQIGKRPKALVWTAERVAAWQTAYGRELAAERERAGGRTATRSRSGCRCRALRG
ncbi:tyrosine-type recombinase/integrase [Actinomadura luteofluorescens]